MAATWEIDILPRKHRDDIITVIFKETDGAYKETYSIAVPNTGTPQERKLAVLNKLKTEVLKRRAIRQKIENIKSALSSAEIEAFINS